jgi:hypothetical protein
MLLVLLEKPFDKWDFFQSESLKNKLKYIFKKTHNWTFLLSGSSSHFGLVAHKPHLCMYTLG